jgi:catechol 2,3-dioxygenase-like lactoylglutathione lyase family enzyme
MQLSQVTLVVADYDEAIGFFAGTLGFRLVKDTKMSETKRWVVVEPPGGGCRLLLAKAANDEQQLRIGSQTGGRVAFFLHTDNFARDFEKLKAGGVRIVRGPAAEEYGTVAVFADLYGNLWDLVGPV